MFKDEARGVGYLGENAQAVVSLLIPYCSNFGDIARDFCGD